MAKKYSIELSWEQIDGIVNSELQHIYDLESKTGYDGHGVNVEPNQRLLDAIETVLDYCMAPSAFDEWKQNR